MKKLLYCILLVQGCTVISSFYTRFGSADHYFYEATKSLLTKYQRPFTVMELWAHEGNLTCLIADKFDKAVCIMHEDQHFENALKNCKAHAHLSNIILLKSKLLVEDLNKFGECEHIDVVLVHDITKKFIDTWKEAINAILTFGDYIIIEAPSQNCDAYESVTQFLVQKEGKLIESPHNALAQRKLFLIATHKQYLFKRRWNYIKRALPGEYTVESTFTEKKLIKQKQNHACSITPWHSGINLFTFKKLHGIYPLKETIRASLKTLSNIEHNDLHIFNLIIQGKTLVPIDCSEEGRHLTVKHQLQNIIKQFRHPMTLTQFYEMDIEVLEKLDEQAYASF